MDYGSRAEYDFAKLGGDEDSGKKDAAAAATTLSLDTGLQFGLTDATSNPCAEISG
jgi:hypothetical protein